MWNYYHMQLQSKCFNLAHLSHWNKMLVLAVGDNTGYSTALIVGHIPGQTFLFPFWKVHPSQPQGLQQVKHIITVWLEIVLCYQHPGAHFKSLPVPKHICWSKSLVSLQPKPTLAISAEYRVPKAKMHIQKTQFQKLLNTWVWRWNMIYTQSKKLATGHFSNSWAKKRKPPYKLTTSK